MADGKTKNLQIVILYWSTKIYNVLLLSATYSCKIKNVFANVELNVLKYVDFKYAIIIYKKLQLIYI